MILYNKSCPNCLEDITYREHDLKSCQEKEYRKLMSHNFDYGDPNLIEKEDEK